MPELKKHEIKSPDRQTVFNLVPAFIEDSRKEDSDILIVNTNVFFDPYAEEWCGTISHYDS